MKTTIDVNDGGFDPGGQPRLSFRHDDETALVDVILTDNQGAQMSATLDAEILEAAVARIISVANI